MKPNNQNELSWESSKRAEEILEDLKTMSMQLLDNTTKPYTESPEDVRFREKLLEAWAELNKQGEMNES